MSAPGGTTARRSESGTAPGGGLLDNPASQRVARVAGLARRAARAKRRRFLVEGPQGVREAVRFAAGHVVDLYVLDGTTGRHAEILRAARAAGIYIHRVSAAVMSAMSADAQGILAVVSAGALPLAPGAGAPEESDPAAALSAALAGARLVVVLTETQDPGNAGTIIRTADAAGADAVVLLRGSVEATNPKVVRSSAGSLFHLPVLTGVEPAEAVSALRHEGLGLVAADARGPSDLFAADELLAAPTAWLFGNEARGLDPAVLSVADAVVSVPIFGRAESLNVATAAAVCLFASARAQNPRRSRPSRP